MALVIKKRVSLEQFGDEYKDAELIFKSLPIPKFKEFQKKLPKVNERYAQLVRRIDSDEATPEEHEEFLELKSKEDVDPTKSIDIMLDLLKDCFISGKFPDEKGNLQDVTKEDLNDIDIELARACFDALTGKLSPKV